MKIKIKIIFFIACMLYRITDSVDIQCNYYTLSFVAVNSVYSCYLQNTVNIKSRESAVIDSAIGSHSENKTKADVECFFSENSRHVLQYFPRNLENIFINLKTIGIRHGRLKEIKQSDLQPFPKLVFLKLDNNDIDILEDGLFAYNPELEYICIKQNKLVHIGHQVFDNLSKLSWLFLESNSCINMKANSSQADVKKVINQAKVKCLGFSEIEKNLQKLEDSLVCVSSETLPVFDQKLQNLQNEFLNSTISHYMPLKDRFQAILSLKSKSLWSVKDKVSAIEGSVINATSKILTEMKNLKNDFKALGIGQTSTDDKIINGFNESLSQLINSRIAIISALSDNFSKASQTLKEISQEMMNKSNSLEIMAGLGNLKSDVISNLSSIASYIIIKVHNISYNLLNLTEDSRNKSAFIEQELRLLRKLETAESFALSSNISKLSKDLSTGMSKVDQSLKDSQKLFHNLTKTAEKKSNDKLNSLETEMSNKITNLESSLLNLSNDLRNSSQTSQRYLSQKLNRTKTLINDKMLELNDSINTKITEMSDKLDKAINDRITALEINFNKAFKLKEENIKNETRNLTTKNGFKYFIVGFCLILCIFNIVLIIATKRFFVCPETLTQVSTKLT